MGTGFGRHGDVAGSWCCRVREGCKEPELISSVSVCQKLQRSAALKVDWAKITTSLGLRGQTVAGLQAFKKRNDDIRRKVQLLSEQPTTVDFAQYRSVLKNQAIVDEIEKRFNAFQPATYDLGRQLKAIEAFEVEAIKNAEATKDKVDLELQDLQKTLKNIEEARPFEELTVDEVAAAEPSIDEKTSKLVSKGRWSVPGYKVRLVYSSPVFPAMQRQIADPPRPANRRDSATSRSCKQLLAARFPFFFVYSSIVDSLSAEGGSFAEGERISPC